MIGKGAGNKENTPMLRNLKKVEHKEMPLSTRLPNPMSQQV